IDADLRHVPMSECASEKSLIARMHEDVQHSRLKRWIRGMTVRFPATVDQVKFDAATHDLIAVDANHSVCEIGSGFTIPSAELHDLDFLTARSTEGAAEVTGKPTRLQFQL
ncbi:MAG: hypothetical protein M3Y69_01985, partial [Verrucomicrobiota bacterium]|nr:hypothetical protein [Verrucomicrobiota bacterium]